VCILGIKERNISLKALPLDFRGHPKMVSVILKTIRENESGKFWHPTFSDSAYQIP